MSFPHLVWHSLKLLRFAWLGYRFKTLALPLLKAHLWLHYFYPLAAVIGAYPSLIEPNLLALEAGGGATLLRPAYRLLRVIKFSASPSFLWGSYKHIGATDEAMAEAWDSALNANPALGTAEGGSSDLNYGWGGYWGSDQTENLVGRLNNIRPYFQSLESPNAFSYPFRMPPLYRIAHPHPTGPITPPLERPLSEFLDGILPRTNMRFEPLRAVTPQKFSNLNGEDGSIFYRKFEKACDLPLR
jgi:hypothetical protein